MKIRRFALICGLAWGCAALTLSACGNKGDDSGGDGDSDGAASGGGDGDASGGDGDGDAEDEPVITSAPPAWVLPSDCKGVGNSCSFLVSGCQDPDSICQLDGEVCIPPEIRSQTAETPYCAAYTCMTFEEASCFCLGEVGVQRADCASPEQLAGLCGGSYDDCESAADCCEGMACIPERYSGDLHCRQTCETDAECTSGCCTDSLDTGVSICSDARFCETACKVRGETDCTDGDPNTPTLCCRGTCVQSENDATAGCRPRCDESSDCHETNCCLPFSGNNGGFCGPSDQCDESGEPLIGSTSSCNDGAGCDGGETCVISELADWDGCQPACTTNDDCASGCCEPFQGQDDGFCVDAIYCGCVDAGGSCGPSIDCCEGSQCLGDGTTFQCRAECEVDEDCSTNCCVDNTTVGGRFCVEPSYCGL